MLHRIIGSDGIVVHAKNYEIYSIISCIDGLDYIIELVNNEKSWKLYDSLNDVKNSINISETELPLLNNSQDDIEIQNDKKKGRKPKVVIDNDNGNEPNVNQESIINIKPETSVNDIIIENKPIIKIIKKKGRPPKIKPVEIVESESEEEEVIIKKKIIRLKEKPPEKPPNIVIDNDIDNENDLDNKKLSDYHIFISDFLSKNNDIVWNERMKAANESWKSYKCLKSSKSPKKS
jgi:hypothetical protein